MPSACHCRRPEGGTVVSASSTVELTQRDADTARGLDMVPLSLTHAALLASALGRLVDPDYHGWTPQGATAALDAAEAMAESMHPALYDDRLFRRAVEASALPTARDGRRPMETMLDAAHRVLIAGVARWQRRNS